MMGSGWKDFSDMQKREGKFPLPVMRVRVVEGRVKVLFTSE